MTSETELLAIEAKVIDLFDGWPNAKPTQDTVRAYLSALEGLSLEAVIRSVDQFTRGMVERNNAFPPSGPELAENARLWQEAINKRDVPDVKLYTGLLNVDFGQGRIDMRGLTEAEQDQVLANKGLAPDGRSLAYQPLAYIQQALKVERIDHKDKAERKVIPRLKGMGG